MYNQVMKLANISNYVTNYQKIIHSYTVIYLVLLCIWTILISVLIYISLRAKKQDMLKWRIMGFSNRFIVSQTILEGLIPVLLGILTAALFFLVCQHTYEFLLVQIRPFITNEIGIEHVSFFSSDVIVESTPNELTKPSGDILFLSLGWNQLSSSIILHAFIKSCLILLFLAITMISFLTYFFSKNTKQVFRM